MIEKPVILGRHDRLDQVLGQVVHVDRAGEQVAIGGDHAAVDGGYRHGGPARRRVDLVDAGQVVGVVADQRADEDDHRHRPDEADTPDPSPHRTPLAPLAGAPPAVLDAVFQRRQKSFSQRAPFRNMLLSV